MSLRPLVSVSGLTFGDYLLWNWSLNGNHDVIALISGLTLPPLALAFLCLLALSFGRLLAHITRARARRTGARSTSRRAPQASAQSAARSESARSSRKIAA